MGGPGGWAGWTRHWTCSVGRDLEVVQHAFELGLLGLALHQARLGELDLVVQVLILVGQVPEHVVEAVLDTRDFVRRSAEQPNAIGLETARQYVARGNRSSRGEDSPTNVLADYFAELFVLLLQCGLPVFPADCVRWLKRTATPCHSSLGRMG